MSLQQPRLAYTYAALSDVGRRRTSNQDSGYASPHLLVIADGMGGAAAGDLASSEVMHVVRRLDGPPPGDVIEALAGAVHRANDRLAEVIEDDPSVEGMGTTLTALLWNGAQFGLAHIGDSRAYLMRDGQLHQITKDHTLVQSLVDEGRLTREGARTHPNRSLILRVLLGRDESEPDLTLIEPQLGDRYLLCSDGLSDMVDDDAIADVLRTAPNVDVAAVDLVQRALVGGGADNVTVILGEMVDPEAPVDPTLACADEQPMLVGAAAEQARPGGDTSTTATSLDAIPLPPDEVGVNGERGAGAITRDIDPEALRYAPRAPRRHIWLRRLVVVALVVALLAAAAKLAWDWTQHQYYVGTENGVVVIYRGIQADLPLIDVDSVEEVSDVRVDALPTFRANQVKKGIASTSLTDARDTVTTLRDIATLCADPAQANLPGNECGGAE
ncbi:MULTISPECIES: PP2C family protein-serine/threonine phosphatase [Mumia]|uniref:PP2C family protein-serine/threonine phosphatase n=1 Tax=Mumia TaxID=1546255 RepID=UPI00141DC25B|nr:MULTISPECIES: protein phosphatase 2C domain-containing protein [unclassified Mumia]QMW66448.1 serine/threonine-protein phosphatase [Mumia sp. ZJ1417]